MIYILDKIFNYKNSKSDTMKKLINERIQRNDILSK